MRYLKLSFCLLLFLGLLKPYEGFGQVMHVGRRATCPICNAYLLKTIFEGGEAAVLTESQKLRYIKREFPKANPADVLKVYDSFAEHKIATAIKDRDHSFATFTVDFGNGKTSKFYKLTDCSTGKVYEGNRVNVVLDEISANYGDSRSVYLFIDNMYSEESRNFQLNVENHNVKNKSSKLKPVGSDVYVDAAGVTRHLGTKIFNPHAKLLSVSSIQETLIKQETNFVAEAVFRSGGEEIKFTFWGKVRSKLNDFITNLKSIFIATPETSIAKAINRSRIFTGSKINAAYMEAGSVQYVDVKTVNGETYFASLNEQKVQSALWSLDDDFNSNEGR